MEKIDLVFEPDNSRAADYVGAQAKTAIDALTASPVASLVAGAVLAVGWAGTGWLLGRKHDESKT